MATVKRKAKGFTWRGLQFEVTSEAGWTEWTSWSGHGWNWKVCRYKSGECDARLRVAGQLRFGSGICKNKTAALDAALARAHRDCDAINNALLEFDL